MTTHQLAHQALARIWQLYELEDRLTGATPEQRLAARREEATPILQRLYDDLSAARHEVRPTSKLAEAIGYCLNRWDAMIRYATDGRYPIDNNAAERALRPAVIGRKNYQFFGSDDGGRAAAVWYAFIDSARRNQARVFPYLCDVAERVPTIVPEYLRRGDAESAFSCLSQDQLDALAELLPDRWIAQHPEHRSAERQQELDQQLARRRLRYAVRRQCAKA